MDQRGPSLPGIVGGDTGGKTALEHPTDTTLKAFQVKNLLMNCKDAMQGKRSCHNQAKCKLRGVILC